MKRAITTLMAAMLLGLAFTSCEKEDTTGGNNGGGNNNGPVITDDDTGIELNMSNSGNDRLRFETNYINYYGNIGTASFYLCISNSNNFYFEYNNGQIEYDIARVGTMTSMSSINSIPSTGWVKQIAVNPGTGYIIRYKGEGFGYIYARLYVKDWIVSTGGGIIGATIVYQDKWGQDNGQDDSEESIAGTTWRLREIDEYVDFTFTIEFLWNGIGRELREIHLTTGESNSQTINFTYYYDPNTKDGVIEQENGAGETYSFHIEGEQLSILDGNSAGRVLTKI